MAIGFARMEFVKRSKAKSVVGKAAYNAKAYIYFEGNCVIPARGYDWSKSTPPISHSIILPDHVDNSFKAPSCLWNSVEKSEYRKDAQVGKEVVIALPDDSVISNKQRIEMAENFAKKFFVAKGYGVQVDVHPPKLLDNISQEVDEELEKIEKNYHAHILVTERHFNENGNGFSQKKVNDTSPEVRGNFHFAYNGIEWGKLWTQFQNEYFDNAGIDLRVDQPKLIAQVHLGPLRMRSKRAYEILGEFDKREELGQLLALDPKIVLQKLTENKSVFEELDFEIFLQKFISDNDKEKISESFWKSKELVQLFDRESKTATKNFSSVEVYEEERQILRLSDTIFKKKRILSDVKISSQNLNTEQQRAFEKVTDGRYLSCIEGLAGTGKSYLLVALKNFYKSQGLKVRAFGPDNATVKVLQEKGFEDCRSIHGILFKNFFSKKNIIQSGKEVWIIDEASKLGNKPLLELLKLAETNNIRLVFSGNSAQLSSVDRGGLFRELCNRYGYAFLQEVQRQNQPIHREISKKLAYGDVNSAISMIANSGGFVWKNTKEESLLSLMEKWADDRLNYPYDTTAIIAHTNQEVRQLNDLAHTIRMSRGEVSEKEFECQTTRGKVRVSEGDLIEFRENSKKFNVKNGDRGVLIKATEKEFTVKMNEKEISFDPRKFLGFQLAYAVTYFRSQGDTVHRSYIAYSPLMSQKLLYVGRTRHIKEAHCFVSYSDAKCLTDIKRQMIEKREIDNTINYTTLGEIEKEEKIKVREKKIDQLCSSDSFLSQAKGYSSKVFNFVKSGVDQYIEKIQDRKLDKNFYIVPEENSKTGKVFVVKEENLSSEKIKEKTQTSIKELKSEKSLSNNHYKNLPENVKNLYRNYFEKVGISNSLSTIVQSEASMASVSKTLVPSFVNWQKACGERNEAAHELLRIGVNQRSVLGEKGYQILRDRAETHNNVNQPKESLHSQLLSNFEPLLYRLFPEGPFRQDKRGFRFGAKGSLAVTCAGEKKGCFYNFETREGGNLITLIEKKLDLDKKSAIEWSKKFLNEVDAKVTPSHFSTDKFVKVKEDKWTSLVVPSNMNMPSLGSLSRYIDAKYTLIASHAYCNVNGEVACYNLRLEDKENGKKMFLPLTYGKIHLEDNPSWRFKGHSERSELLYNAQLLKLNPEKPILIVEGEKTADAASKILEGNYIVVTWLGGAAAAKEANWKLLNGRDVVIWPDNDAPGFKAAYDIGDSLRRVGVNSLKIVDKDVLKEFPPKWDIADSLPEGKGSKFIENTILRAENKAIGVDRLSLLAGQYNVPLNVINDIVADVDKNTRKNLEEKNGLKTWETDAAILIETTRILDQRKTSVNDTFVVNDISLNTPEKIKEQERGINL